MFRPRSLDPLPILVLCALVICGAISNACAENVILFLKSGDRVSGVVISENTNRTVLSNTWSMELTVPADQIVRRERVDTWPSPAVTNTEPARLAIQSKPPATGPNTNRWKGETQVGLDLRYGASDRHIYYGRFKLGYERPYRSDPKRSFRNGFDYLVEYGKTEGVKSSDRMAGAMKTAFDLQGKWYAYNLVGAGYDHIKKIDFQYEAGPGVGYHLITRTNFSMNLEAGLNYQAQYRSDDTQVQDPFYRLAEDVTWKIRDRLSFAERFEFFPRVDLEEFRFRLETTLSYELYRNFSLNLIVLDLFDTAPADDVDRNELQIRVALGIKF
jgi:putative salt-induced outer membrane protein YdiY